jgi:hypothetical protein
MKTKERTLWIMAPMLAISIGFLVPIAAAQSVHIRRWRQSTNT